MTTQKVSKYIIVRHSFDNISPKVAYVTEDIVVAETMSARLNSAVKEVLDLKDESDKFVLEFEKNKPENLSDGDLKAFRLRRKHALMEWVESRLSPLALKVYINAGEATYKVEKVEEELIIW